MNMFHNERINHCYIIRIHRIWNAVGGWHMGQQTIHSLAIGSIYALLAVGLNFMSVAHRSLYLVYGGLYALGGYVAWWVVRSQRPIWIAFGGAVILSACLGMLSYWSMRLRVPHGSEMSRLLSGLGLLVCLAELSRLGISSYRMKVIAIDGHQVAHIGPLMVTDIHWLVFGSTFALFTAGQGFLTTSRLGRALRAFLDEPYTAVHGGTQTVLLRLCACGLGAALAGMSGVLAGLYLNDIYPAMGIAMTYKVLALMLIGTLVGLRGAVLAAFALALLEGLVLPVIYRPLLSDATLLVTLAVVSCVSSQEKRDLQWGGGE
jgi:branched-chain amino acid transport system permease protein